MKKGLFLGLMLVMTIYTKILVMDVQDLRKLGNNGDFKKLEHMMEEKHAQVLVDGFCNGKGAYWFGKIDPNSGICYPGQCENVNDNNKPNQETFKCDNFGIMRRA